MRREIGFVCQKRDLEQNQRESKHENRETSNEVGSGGYARVVLETVLVLAECEASNQRTGC